jgi:hypothetical protein
MRAQKFRRDFCDKTYLNSLISRIEVRDTGARCPLMPSAYFCASMGEEGKALPLGGNTERDGKLKP